MTGVWALAALWLGLALIASLVSIWLRISTALSEIAVGTIAQLIIGAAVGSAVLGTDKSWAARRSVTQRARKIAEEQGQNLQIHVVAGHPVRTIVELAREIRADLLVIGATGHSALYERMIGSRADRIVQLAPCPVPVVK